VTLLQPAEVMVLLLNVTQQQQQQQQMVCRALLSKMEQHCRLQVELMMLMLSGMLLMQMLLMLPTVLQHLSVS
jgi:hypothetical protein